MAYALVVPPRLFSRGGTVSRINVGRDLQKISQPRRKMCLQDFRYILKTDIYVCVVPDGVEFDWLSSCVDRIALARASPAAEKETGLDHLGRLLLLQLRTKLLHRNSEEPRGVLQV